MQFCNFVGHAFLYPHAMHCPEDESKAYGRVGYLYIGSIRNLSRVRSVLHTQDKYGAVLR